MAGGDDVIVGHDPACQRHAALTPPFDAAPRLDPGDKRAVERVALQANDRYLHEFLERYAFCPFAKQGRIDGTSVRYVYVADTLRLEPLLDLMAMVASKREHVVSQVIMPLIEVEPEAWTDFCFELTKLGHIRMGGRDVLAVAPLHPQLPFNSSNPFALVPLFRRTPDPTIQWVRLDGLEALYEGRGRGSHYVDPQDVPALLAGPTPPQPLYDRVAETNMSMAKRLTVATVEETLAAIHRQARRSYVDILLRSEHEG
jgi:hypothetical protein